MADLGTHLTPVIAALLEPGEELRGTCIATRQSLFKGQQVAVGVTDRRLIVQAMTRRFEADGEAISLPPERIAEARADGAGGGWPNLRAAVMDQVALTVRLRTREGEKLKLMMMLGGSGLLGSLGGGETQCQGVETLAAWFAEHEPRSGA